MAQNAVVYQFDFNVSNVDRGIYETFSLKVAQHPSESLEYLLTRVLALCIEYEPGMAFGQSIGTNGGDEPAVWLKDYTGQVKVWIEVGLPDADKLHRANKLAERVLIYTHRDAENLRRNLANKTIYQAGQITVRSFERGFLSGLVGRLDRRNNLDASITEGQLYLTLNGTTAETPIFTQSLQEA
ncbi:MAG: YaeQ family protein [Anaerolineae bacterium]|nr:YaeQ family protein [Anaerolineae bacterium]